MHLNAFKLSVFLLLLSNSMLLRSDPISSITWTDSFLSEDDHMHLDRMKFGYLVVPEDYDKPEGKKIKVAFIVIKAAIDESAIDACFYFTGGWGVKTIQNLPYYHNHFLSYRKDLILFDARGTGYSVPSLCPDLGKAVFDNVIADRSYAEFEARQKELFDDCLDDLEEKGIDFNQYGTSNVGKDAIELAKALGYESYNLFGVSYGTKKILQFIRQSEVNIRSVILDSNCPLDFPINSGMTEDYAQSLQAIMKECENDSNCNKKYPDLREKLESFLNSLDKKPLKIKLPQSRTAYLNKQEVNGVIHQMLYDEGYYGYMPFLLKKFYKRNKFVLKRIIRNMEPAVLANYEGLGLVHYVYDHKAMQHMAKEIAEKAISNNLAYQVFDGYQAYYLKDKRFEVNATQTKMKTSEIPALIMAGRYDPVTPVAYSERLRPYFSNHYYVEFPRTGHGVTNNYCGKEMAEFFLNTLENPLENDCLESVKEQEIVFEK